MLKINYIIEAKGVIDELNCHLGKAIAISKIDLPEIVEEIIEIQKNNFLVSYFLNNEIKIKRDKVNFLEKKKRDIEK